MGPPLVFPGVEDHYPGNLTLKQVQILFRHGERTPVHRSIQQWDKWGFPIFWPLCDSSRSSRVGLINPKIKQVTTFEYEREIETLTEEDPSPLFANGGRKGVCTEGQLTDKGRLSGHYLGEQLRELYVDKLAFLPRNFTKPSDIYLRSTGIVRSRETLLEVFNGLYPLNSHSATPRILERFPFEENLHPNVPCRRLSELGKQFRVAAAKKWNPKLEDASHVLKDILSSPEAKITVDSSGDTAWAIIDTYSSALAHNVKAPPGFANRQVVNTVARAALETAFAGFEKNAEMKQLGMGRFFAEVLQRMTVGDPVGSESAAEISQMLGRKETKVHRKVPMLALYGAHDSSIGAILSSLGVFDYRWINFTSHITFELFEENAKSSTWSLGGPGKFVRIKYNGRPVAIPACQQRGSHWDGDKSFCTLIAFQEFVHSVTPRDWDSQCNEHLGEQAPELKEASEEFVA
ncbi:histidine phosphatase superfamily [Lipomyces kononenkoae]|uniref:Histidine phosphatase superfamily n=1 Tax=Lipomyces kononenkoae TaxID=34357 RepID=A0ACC3SVB0_LIPKO